ncbi:MAG TPA: hypothetical protein PKO06_09830, partial [Candidatus Ozemobacteraceae bacterium]|nr:hypothetical protein [Candidatus Ozemobacteraceae bacterium]
NTQGQRLNTWGQDRLNQGGVGNTIVGGLAVAGGHVTQGVAQAGKFVSDAWSAGTNIVGNGIKRLGSLFD